MGISSHDRMNYTYYKYYYLPFKYDLRITDYRTNRVSHTCMYLCL